MDNVEEQILSYPSLSTQKKREVAEYVERHPEWAPLLQDVRAFETLSRKASLDADASTESFLHTYVVAQYFTHEEIPSRLRNAFARLEERLADDPDLQAQADAIRQQLQEAEAAVDPVAHFEALTGHSLSANSQNAPETPSSPPAADRPANDRAPASPSRSVTDQLSTLSLPARLGGAAIALLLGVYAVLFISSRASQSTLDQLATVKVSDQMVESYYSTNTRSVAPVRDSASASDLYLDALSSLRSARTSTFGLFPRFKPDSLQEAESKLLQVLERTESESFLALEAQFYLGKAYLAQGRVAAARDRFTTVVDQNGRRAQEAEEILSALREMSSSDTEPANP